MRSDGITVTAKYRLSDAACLESFRLFVDYQGGGGPGWPQGGGVDNLASRLVDVRPLDDRWVALVDYELQTGATSISTLVSVVAGMLPFFPGVELLGLEPAPRIANLLRTLGPGVGSRGLRTRLNCVPDSPLLGGILKPPHLALELLADRAVEMLRGGVDIVKDDDLAVPAPLEAIRRLKALAPAVRREVERRSRDALLFVYCSGTIDEILGVAEAAVNSEAWSGLMLAPGLVGYDTIAAVRQRLPSLPLALHPTLMHPYIGMTTQVLLARLAGGDLLILPAPDRFPRRFTVEDAKDALACAGAALPGVPDGLLGFGGGLNPERSAWLRQALGQNIAVLVGSWAASRRGGQRAAFRELRDALEAGGEASNLVALKLR